MPNHGCSPACSSAFHTLTSLFRLLAPSMSRMICGEQRGPARRVGNGALASNTAGGGRRGGALPCVAAASLTSRAIVDAPPNGV